MATLAYLFFEYLPLFNCSIFSFKTASHLKLIFSLPVRRYGKSYGTTPSIGAGIGISEMLCFCVKAFHVMGKMLTGKPSCTWTGLVGKLIVLRDFCLDQACIICLTTLKSYCTSAIQLSLCLYILIYIIFSFYIRSYHMHLASIYQKMRWACYQCKLYM